MDTPAVEVDQVTFATASPNEIIGAVRELVALMSKGGITELDLSTGDVSIRLRGESASVSPTPVTTAAASGAAEAATDPEPEGHIVTAPMIGTYYASPAPGEAPFVRIGDEVEIGQVVGIIEAMKIMNEILSDRTGVVLDVLVDNAQAVEYGSPLIRLGDQADFLS